MANRQTTLRFLFIVLLSISSASYAGNFFNTIKDAVSNATQSIKDKLSPSDSSAQARRNTAGLRDKQSVLRAQSLLKGLGYNVVADGIYGNNTASAIRSYQRSEGLKQDGLVTSGLLENLERSSNEQGRAPRQAQNENDGNPVIGGAVVGTAAGLLLADTLGLKKGEGAALGAALGAGIGNEIKKEEAIKREEELRRQEEIALADKRRKQAEDIARMEAEQEAERIEYKKQQEIEAARREKERQEDRCQSLVNTQKFAADQIEAKSKEILAIQTRLVNLKMVMDSAVDDEDVPKYKKAKEEYERTETLLAAAQKDKARTEEYLQSAKHEHDSDCKEKPMPDQWEPNAPNVQQSFDHSRSKEQDQEQKREPVTKHELDQLQNERETPAPEQSLTIGGEVKTAVHERVAMEREQRIKQIKERMAMMEGIARDDFNKSR